MMGRYMGTTTQQRDSDYSVRVVCLCVLCEFSILALARPRVCAFTVLYTYTIHSTRGEIMNAWSRAACGRRRRRFSGVRGAHKIVFVCVRVYICEFGTLWRALLVRMVYFNL